MRRGIFPPAMFPLSIRLSYLLPRCYVWTVILMRTKRGKWLCYVKQYSFPRSRSLRLRASVWIRFTLFRHSTSFLLRPGDSASTLRGEIKSHLLDGFVAVCALWQNCCTLACKGFYEILHFYYLYLKLLNIRFVSEMSFSLTVGCVNTE